MNANPLHHGAAERNGADGPILTAGDAEPRPPRWRDLLPPDSRLAVLGATGLVGGAFLDLLEARGVPAGQVDLLASARQGGRTLPFAGETLPVQEATPERLAAADLVLASAGSGVSRALLPGAAAAGAVCVDNSSAFRMDDGVPLVVPEVNGERLESFELGARGGIIASPNCSTIQLVCALGPIARAAGLRRVVVSTYQSMSGAGRSAMQDLRSATQALLGGAPGLHESLTHVPAFDVHPGIGDRGDGVDAEEEAKLVNETVKILGVDVAVDAHAVRVPVMVGHAESVTLETERDLSLAGAAALLRDAPGVTLVEGDAPTPRSVAGSGSVHVARLRPTRVFPQGLQMWVVADNLLKGAALNAVQIADRIVAQSAAALA